VAGDPAGRKSFEEGGGHLMARAPADHRPLAHHDVGTSHERRLMQAGGWCSASCLEAGAC
jgi:hypothetical protein